MLLLKKENLEMSDKIVKAILDQIQNYDHMKLGSVRLVIVFGLLCDFDSFEYIHYLKSKILAIERSKLKVIIFAIGDKSSKHLFCKYNNSKFYKRFKELVTYFSFPKINLSTELEICAEIIFQDKKHLNNNPKIISKENIIDLLKIINITDISTKN